LHFQPRLAASPLAEQVAAEVRQTRRDRVWQALSEAKGNKSMAAALLGITRKTLYAWLRELGAQETE
jgi:transcriptional regulator of acetoin/glycerol metabolism